MYDAICNWFPGLIIYSNHVIRWIKIIYKLCQPDVFNLLQFNYACESIQPFLAGIPSKDNIDVAFSRTSLQ